jgi:hypothetical protein
MIDKETMKNYMMTHMAAFAIFMSVRILSYENAKYAGLPVLEGQWWDIERGCVITDTKELINLYFFEALKKEGKLPGQLPEISLN